VPEYSQADLMAMVHESHGLYLTGHPMDEYAMLSSASALSKSEDIIGLREGGREYRVPCDQQVTITRRHLSAVKTKDDTQQQA
jgi:hypothetical protein